MEKLYTVKDFAEQANISQQAVYKQLNSRLKPFIHTVNGQKFIEAAALEKFYSTQIEQPFNPDSTAENLDIQPRVVQSNSTVIQPEKVEQKQHELENQIKELQEQIKKILENEQEERQFLRDQMKQKDKQIESLTENLKMAQQLAAADKKKVIELEAKQAEIEIADSSKNTEIIEDNKEQEQKKKGILARLFNL